MSVQHHRGHDRFDMFGLEMPFAESRADPPAWPGPRAWQAEGYQSEDPPAKAEDPPGLEDMLRLPGRFDDPKRDPAVDKDGTRFSSFLRGRNRREFARDWLAKTPRLAEARSAPQADLADGDIAKAWFVIHDVGVKSSLADMRYKANQAATKKSSVHGFLNRAGYFAATHDFAKNKMGTVYEFLSVKGKKVAGGKTINIETVPDIENGVAIGRDGKPAPPANADRYASIGYRNAHGAKKVNYYKWTHAAFETLADLYILASARAGHLLTITAHKEMDRNLGRSVIWREYKAKQLRETTNKYLVKARDRPDDYHGDPYAFDIQALYDVITRKLNALGGEQMPKGVRYGVHPMRLRKANGLDIGNGSGQLHEFPHQSDPQVKKDTGLKKSGWWLGGTKAEAELESEFEDPWKRERFDPEWSGEDEERSGEEKFLADTHDFEDEDSAMIEESLDGEEPEWSGETTVPWGESALHDETGEERLAWLDFEDPLISAFEGDGESPQYEASPRAARAPAAKPMLGGMVWTAMHRPTLTKVTTFVTPRALKQEQVEVLFYVHGLLGPCGRPPHGMESLIASKMFRLAANAVASGRPIILVVPQFQDGNDASWRSRGLGQPSALNRMIAATSLEVSRRTATAVPQASALIVAGHSRAYGVLFALAGAHASSAMAEGALARLSEIWALDASYGSFPHQAFDALLAAKPALKVSVVYRADSPTDKFKGKAAAGRLALIPVVARDVSHCAVPAHAMPKLLAGEPVEGARVEQGEFESGWYEALEETKREGWSETLDTSFESEWDEAQGSDAPGNEAQLEGEAFGYHDAELDEGELGSEGENAITAAGLTPAERKALEITSTYETGKRGGFFGLSGNFDGQGLSFGLVNWTIGTGSLQPLLRAFIKAQPQRWVSIFGLHATSFRDLIAGKDKVSIKRQLAFAIQDMNEQYIEKGRTRWRIREPWQGYFRKLADDTAFQEIQIHFARGLLAKADEYCRRFGLKSERAFAFMFDTVSSHGMWWLTKKKGGRPERQIRLNASIEQIKLRHGGSAPEDEVLLAIADVLAATSLPRWREKVRIRKRWFVTGQHPRAKELRGLEPRPDVPYAFGGSAGRTAQELEPEDEDLAFSEADSPSTKMEELEDEDEHEHDENELDEALEGECEHGHTHEREIDGTAGEAEYFDDEERDAAEASAGEASVQNAWQERFEPEVQAAGSTAQLPAPLSSQQRAWVLALERSALERLPDGAERTRFLEQDWSDVEFPGNVPKGQSATDKIKRHWALARSLFKAMAEVTPERRVPRMISFRNRPAVKVPGQSSERLYAEARDAFVRMHAAAKAEGVDLVILSSWRSRARQAAASANQPNPTAVAHNASAHMYGLAIDLRMGVPGLSVMEINTRVDRATAAKAGTAPKMGNLVRMYRSPVYKWMALRAREFGWYPYRNEPWHWEYNPPGLKARFEGAVRGELGQEARPGRSVVSWEQADQALLHAKAQYEKEDTALSPFLRTFTAKALGVKVAVYVTQAARNAHRVEMLVFAHGLDLCKPVFKNRPATFVTEPPFKLRELVEATGRPIVLVVPFLDWERLDANRMAFGHKWHRLAQPANFNQVAAEALEQVRTITGSPAPPAVQRLILAGHSRAYGFFDALAHEHASPHMRTGALANPTHVWALDTTYSAPIADWRAWLRSREDLQVTIVYRHGTYRTQGSVVRELTTGVRGNQFTKLAAASDSQLTVVPVAAGKVSHCNIPTAYLPRLLAALPPLATSGEHEAEAQLDVYEEFKESEDYAGLVTEAEALSLEDEAIGGEWSEQSANVEELEAPDRFDAFGDERKPRTAI